MSEVPESLAPMRHPTGERLLSLAVVAIGLALCWAANALPGDSGYGVVGPNVLPWVAGGALVLLGAALAVQAFGAGFAPMPAPSGADRPDWASGAWVLAGVLANAGLITRVGFVLSCTVCFVLAAHGLRRSEGRAWAGPAAGLRDAAVGLALALPAFWLFTRFLGISLPALTASGWL